MNVYIYIYIYIYIEKILETYCYLDFSEPELFLCTQLNGFKYCYITVTI